MEKANYTVVGCSNDWLVYPRGVREQSFSSIHTIGENTILPVKNNKIV